MALDVLVIQPGESRLYDMPFDKLLPASATITAVVGVVQLARGLVAGSANLTISGETSSGQIAQFRVQAGAGVLDGERYLITVEVTVSNGDTVKAEGELQVRDIK